MLGGYDGLGESFASVGSYWSDGSPALLDFGTIDELKARIYDFFIGWLDEKNNMSNDPSVDYTSNRGHATHILGDGTSNYSRIDTAFVINWYSTLPGTHEILLNSTNKIGSVRYEKPYELYPKNLVAAVTELTKAQQAESLAQKAFDEADEAVKLAEENVEFAKKILESAKEIETGLEIAEKALEEDNKSLEESQKLLTAAEDNVQLKEKAIKEAEDKVSQTELTVSEAEKVLKEAEQDLENFNEELASLKENHQANLTKIDGLEGEVSKAEGALTTLQDLLSQYEAAQLSLKMQKKNWKKLRKSWMLLNL
jgi:hypothetical protein